MADLKTHWILSIYFALSCLSAFGAETVVWRDSFKPGILQESGWKQVRKAAKDDFKVENGALKALCAFKPYRGSYYTATIPFIRKGCLSFEAKINAGGARNYRHLSLQFRFYNIMTSWSGYGGKWMRSYNGKWRSVGKAPDSKWIKYRIVFDADAGTVEYYINDMESPAMVDNGVTLKPEKDGKGLLGIGNYGLANTTVLNEIRNIRLAKITEAARKAAVGNTAMLFRGVAFDYCQLDKIVRNLKVAKFRNYNLITGLALHAKNNFYLDKQPPPRLSSLPKYIIMADMPLGKSVPLYVQKTIVDAVENGSTLLILGGMFTLNKGEFKNTPVEKILPVKIGSPWAALELKEPARIKTALSGKPMVKYLHPLKLKNGGNVLSRAGEYPFVVAGKYGKGRIIVCLGMPCGKFKPGETPFWKWEKWPEFIAGFMKNVLKKQ